MASMPYLAHLILYGRTDLIEQEYENGRYSASDIVHTLQKLVRDGGITDRMAFTAAWLINPDDTMIFSKNLPILANKARQFPRNEEEDAGKDKDSDEDASTSTIFDELAKDFMGFEQYPIHVGKAFDDPIYQPLVFAAKCITLCRLQTRANQSFSVLCKKCNLSESIVGKCICKCIYTPKHTTIICAE